MKPVFAYVRVSTAKQGERGSSLQEQRAAIEAYAKRHDLPIEAWFEELETAAKRGRRVFNTMLALLRQGKAAGVIIHKIDRGARNLRDWADLGELIDRGVAVHFAHESLDLHSRGGRLSADIQAVVAADYIRNLRDEVKKGFYGRLKQGFYPLPAPIGYTNNGAAKAKTPDPASAPLVGQAFELYASGQYNLESLGEELFNRGLRTRGGKRLSRSTLSGLLNNEFYVGIIRIARTGEVFQGVHEPLISKSLFDQVQAVLGGRARSTGYTHDFLYRRLLRCTQCGYGLTAERQKGRIYYRCHSRSCRKICVREDQIDGQVRDGLATLAFRPSELEQFSEAINCQHRDEAKSREDHAQALQLQLAALDERLARLTDALIDGLVERELFEERKGALLHERTSVREKLAEYENGGDQRVAKAQSFFELLKALSDNKNWANPLDRRDFIQEATSNLLIDKNRLVFAWRPPFQLLVSAADFQYCGPHRYGLRTRPTHHTDKVARKAKRNERGGSRYRRLARQVLTALTAASDPPSHSRLRAAAAEASLPARGGREFASRPEGSNTYS